MAVLKIILTVIFIIISIALTVIILMQEGKSAGLGAIAGAADTYWGQEQRTFHGGKTGNRNQDSGCLICCDCCCIESGNFLRNAKDCREYDSLFLPFYYQNIKNDRIL